MNKDAKSTIKVSEILAAIVGSRDLTDNALKDAIAKTSTALVDLDFSNVEFISRSAAHELLSLKEDLSRKRFGRKEINFINASRDVMEMFRVVAANRALPRSAKPEFHAEMADIESLAKTQTCTCC